MNKTAKKLAAVRNEVKSSDSAETNNLYRFSYKKPELEHTSYIVLHEKCEDAGTKKLASWGYQFTKLNLLTGVRTRCAHCKKQLDEKAAKKYVQERDVELARKHEEYLEEKRIRAEWEMEQILLGNHV